MLQAKNASILLLAVLLLSALRPAPANSQEFPVLQGPYLGQDPPGPTPELFAPDIMDAPVGYHSTLAFSPDLSEAYWSPMEREHSLVFSRMVDGRWTVPQVEDFGFERGVGDAAFYPGGDRLYFLSFQPPVPGAPEKERIWFAERAEDGWTKPRLIDDIILAHPVHWVFSFAQNGNLYFTSEMEGVRGGQDIYVARFNGETYLPPEDIGNAINGDGLDMAPFVAPDESYLIFTRSDKDTRKSDIFISFKDSNGAWMKAVSMGDEINSEANELCASVTPEGRYLFFVSQKNGLMNKIYWVDAQIIESLRPQN